MCEAGYQVDLNPTLRCWPGEEGLQLCERRRAWWSNVARIHHGEQTVWPEEPQRELYLCILMLTLLSRVNVDKLQLLCCALDKLPDSWSGPVPFSFKPAEDITRPYHFICVCAQLVKCFWTLTWDIFCENVQNSLIGLAYGSCLINEDHPLDAPHFECPYLHELWYQKWPCCI